MSLADYNISRALDRNDVPFYALIMAAMRRADSANLAALKLVFPQVWDELQARYHLPGGLLAGETTNPDQGAA